MTGSKEVDRVSRVFLFTYKAFKVIPDKAKRYSKEMYVKISVVHNGFKGSVETSKEVEFSFKGVSW